MIPLPSNAPLSITATPSGIDTAPSAVVPANADLYIPVSVSGNVISVSEVLSLKVSLPIEETA